MLEVTIPTLKNHLSRFVQQVEKGEDIKISRGDEVVAVIVPIERYNQAFDSGKGVFSAYLKWKKQYPECTGFTDQELGNMRSREAFPEKKSVW